MNPFHAIQGAMRRALSRKRMIGLYWLFHTLCAALAAVPLMGFIVPHLARSRYGEELLRQFDFMWITELLGITRDSPLTVSGAAAAAAACLAMLGSLFLAGGAVKLIVFEAVPYSPSEFWEGCGRCFWRLLRLMLYSLLFFGAVLLVDGLLNKGARKLWGEGMVEEPLVLALWFRQTLMVLLLGFVVTAMDFSKVRLVADDSRRSLRAAFGSVRFVWAHMRFFFPAWLVLGAIWLLGTWLYVQVSKRIDAVTMPSILFLIVLQQVYVVFRIALRMLSWGTAAEFEQALRPKPEEPAPVMAAVSTEPPSFEASEAEDFSI